MTTEAAPAALDLLGERRFELALAHSPIGMAVVDLDGAFLRTNRALHAMLGYTGSQLTVNSKVLGESLVKAARANSIWYTA